jgi:putative oxidoreductase
MGGLRDLSALAGRVLLALIFVVEGWLKVGNYSGTVAYMQAHGVAGVLLPLVILTELGGGLMVAFGLLTRLAALALASFCLLTAYFFHTDFADPEQVINLYKNLAMTGGFLLLAGFGPGTLSLDAWFRRRPE